MPELPKDLRLILAHKQKTSARVRFLRFSDGLFAFTPLPVLSTVEDEVSPPRVTYHPSAWLRVAEQSLGLEAGSLKPEADFNATVQTPDGAVTIHLASFDTVDPPFAEAEALGARFFAITEMRGSTPVELELLRRAYTTLLG